jgi:hypothetical protein
MIETQMGTADHKYNHEHKRSNNPSLTHITPSSEPIVGEYVYVAATEQQVLSALFRSRFETPFVNKYTCNTHVAHGYVSA